MRYWVLGWWLLAVPAYAQDGFDTAKTVRYLQALQTPGSGCSVTPTDVKAGKIILRATSGVARTLEYLGAKVPDEAGAQKFVTSCFDPVSGGFADVPAGQPNVFSTAVGLMAAKALKMNLEAFQAKSVAYLQTNAQSFEDVRIALAGLEGIDAVKRLTPETRSAWTKTLTTEANDVVTVGGATAALLRLGVPMEQIPNRLAVFAQLRNGQSADGGYLKVGLSVTDLDGTYRVGRALYMAKQAPADRAKLLAFVQKCYNADGGFGTAPGQPSSASGTYYAVLIRQWFADQGK